jgi:hypothetical protein
VAGRGVERRAPPFPRASLSLHTRPPPPTCAGAYLEGTRKASVDAQDWASLRAKYVDAAMADKAGGSLTPAVRHWLRFCVYGRHVSPMRDTNLGIPHGRAASPVPHRPQCTGKPLEAHTPVHFIGWERVDADTDTENDRHAYHPQGRPRTPKPSPVPIQSRLLNTALRPAGRSPRSKNPRARASASGAVARGCFPNTSDLPQSSP